jgi:FkbM family methyltransferase
MNLIKRCRYGLMAYNCKDIWIGKSLSYYGEYSEHEVDLFRHVVKPGDVVLDVGANIGSFSIPLARIVGLGGLVVAIEPERHNFYTLCGNVALNNLRNVFCFQQAAGSQSGSINVPEIDFEATTNFGGIELEKDYSTSAHYPVSMCRIDDLGTPGCNFIKIDVEGMEKAALMGAEGKIRENKPFLYVEDDRKEKSPALREYLRSLGYILYVHCPPFFNPGNFAEEKDNIFDNTISLNLFCRHESVPMPNLDSLSSPLVQA